MNYRARAAFHVSEAEKLKRVASFLSLLRNHTRHGFMIMTIILSKTCFWLLSSALSTAFLSLPISLHRMLNHQLMHVYINFLGKIK